MRSKSEIFKVLFIKMDVKWARNEVNKHKGYGGWQCDCCGHGKNGLRRHRRAPKYMLKALAQGKKVNHYPFPHFPPLKDSIEDLRDEDPNYIPGVSSWKKTLNKQPCENLW